jgi:hypothetical protein
VPGIAPPPRQAAPQVEPAWDGTGQLDQWLVPGSGGEQAVCYPYKLRVRHLSGSRWHQGFRNGIGNPDKMSRAEPSDSERKCAMQRRAVAKIEANELAGGSRAGKRSDTGTDQPVVGFEAFPQDRAELFLRSAFGGSQGTPTFRISDGVTGMPPVLYPDPPKI